MLDPQVDLEAKNELGVLKQSLANGLSTHSTTSIDLKECACMSTVQSCIVHCTSEFSSVIHTYRE